MVFNLLHTGTKLLYYQGCMGSVATCLYGSPTPEVEDHQKIHPSFVAVCSVWSRTLNSLSTFMVCPAMYQPSP
jgi:hypothetical protein